MKLILGQYEHSRIGFPGVVLKWFVENGTITDAYWTLHGIVQGKWAWSNHHPIIQHELDLFDRWVAERWSEDPSVQG